MILTDPFELIKAMPPGSALYGRAGESADKLETCFLIREDEKQIRKIPENPIVGLRSGMWGGPVLIVAVMVKLAGLPYETWWNYHAEDDYGKKSFDDMIQQLMVPVLIYDDRQKRRSVGIRNSLSPFFKKYKEKILAAPAWEMKDFDAERGKIYSRYPSVAALWEALGAHLSQT